MAENPFHSCLFLTGATASGKTAIGVELASLLDAEVVALDSMTLYRGMDIGTAKPAEGERAGVPHHLIDVLDPWEGASVADYRDWAAKAVAEIRSRGKRVLFVGGTPLYLKALLRGLFDGPAADPEIRARLEAEIAGEGSLALHTRLAALDPATAARLHPNDHRRVIRALEVFETTGRPMSELQSEHDRPAPPTVPVVAIDRPRAVLHKRINQRVVRMFQAGLVEEVRRLIEGPQPIHAIPAQGVGYQEVITYLHNGGPESSMIERTQIRTRQFAKRQGTWFRGLDEIKIEEVRERESARECAGRLARLIETWGKA
jgi:tRNA dimethylallyltransferase